MRDLKQYMYLQAHDITFSDKILALNTENGKRAATDFSAVWFLLDTFSPRNRNFAASVCHIAQ